MRSSRTFLSANQNNKMMLTHTSILATLVLSATSLSLENTKAASSSINCGCQCSSITFLDADGNEQGNCKTVDGTGAQWCYVDHLPRYFKIHFKNFSVLKNIFWLKEICQYSSQQKRNL